MLPVVYRVPKPNLNIYRNSIDLGILTEKLKSNNEAYIYGFNKGDNVIEIVNVYL